MQVLLTFFRCQLARHAGVRDFDQLTDIQLIHTDSTVAPHRNNARSIGAESNAIYGASIAIQRKRLGDRFTRLGQHPNFYRAIDRGCDETTPIGAEHYTKRRTCMTDQSENIHSCFGVPYFDGRVIARTGNPPAIGAEGNAAVSYSLAMPAIFQHQLACGCIIYVRAISGGNR